MGFLKKKPQRSGNVNRDLVTGIYAPLARQGVATSGVLAGALGVPGGDSAAANAGFAQFSKNAGFQNVLQKLVQGVTGGQAAQGLLRSGSTSQRILEEGTNLNQQYYNNYLQNLLGLSNLGLGGGNLVANVGQESVGPRQSTAGVIGGLVGKAASIFSDRRLKEAIERIGAFDDGLGIYRFRYKGRPETLVGVMADEVAKLRPWALGKPVAGYATVDYGSL